MIYATQHQFLGTYDSPRSAFLANAARIHGIVASFKAGAGSKSL